MRGEAPSRHCCWLALGLVLIVVGSFEAGAFIPEADRTLRAIARVNRSSGRSEALQLELTLRVGDRPPIARGELISHPSGLARLELRGFNGRIDRYLLSGAELTGAKDGVRLDDPQPMLPPLFFMQPSSQTTMRTALESFEVRSESIGLAPCGEDDCFVIGDPRLAAPLPPTERAIEDILGDPLEDQLAVGGLEAFEAGPPDPAMESVETELAPSFEVIGDDELLARFWVDTENLQVRRIDRGDGVFTIFGPIVSFEKLRVPAWFEIHEPGAAATIRFEVDRAVAVNAPPQAFSLEWLLGPVLPAEPAGAPESVPTLDSAPAISSDSRPAVNEAR